MTISAPLPLRQVPAKLEKSPPLMAAISKSFSFSVVGKLSTTLDGNHGRPRHQRESDVLGKLPVRTCHTRWNQVQGLLLPLDRSRIGPSEINFIITFSLLGLFFFIEQVTCPSTSTPESPASLPIYNTWKGVGLVLVIFFWSIAIKFKTGSCNFLS